MEEVNEAAKEAAGQLSRRFSHPPHIPALDGFRGLAVLLVFLFHVVQVSSVSHGLVAVVLGRMIAAGWIGVDLFFVLSGFLITGILLSAQGAPRYFTNFYARRTLRIFPLYYGVLAVLLALTPIVHFHWQHTTPIFLLYLQNLSLRASQMVLLSPAMNVRLDHLWSLAVEEQFYLLWPLLLFVTAKSRWIWAVPLVPILVCPLARIVASHAGLSSHDLYYWTPFRIDSLAWGGLGAVVLRYRSPRTLELLRRSTLVAGSLICLLVVFKVHGRLYDFAPMVQRYFYTGIDMLSLGTILACLRRNSWPARCFQVRWLRWFGRYSYGIYVFHVMLIGVGEALRIRIDRSTGSKALGAVTLVLGILAVTVTAAYLSFHLYERPFLRLKKRFSEGRPAATHTLAQA